MLTMFARLAFFLCVCLCLGACAPLVTVLGFSHATIQLAVQLDQLKTVADGISYVSSGKTVTDHLVSAATGEDCKLFNAIGPAPVCSHAPQQRSGPMDASIAYADRQNDESQQAQ